MLKDDHKTVKRLFREFDRADNGRTKKSIADKIVEELSVHAYIEEEVFYPEARERVPTTEDLVLEGYEEHHVVKWLMAEIADMSPGEERFEPKVKVLAELVRHHVEEEEEDWFPKVRDALSRTDLAEIGERMEKAKTKAPHTPKPQPAARG